VEEYLIISHNFHCPVDIIVGNRHVEGQVDDIEDDRAMIAGQWYPIKEIRYAQ